MIGIEMTVVAVRGNVVPLAVPSAVAYDTRCSTPGLAPESVTVKLNVFFPE